MHSARRAQTMASLIGNTALFQEVDERIRERIFSRELKPGERIAR
jgi:DNA-binding GntR family transcriptional regulator